MKTPSPTVTVWWYTTTTIIISNYSYVAYVYRDSLLSSVYYQYYTS